MKLKLTLLALFISMNAFSAEYKICKWNDNKRQFVIPNKDTVESIREVLSDRDTQSEKIKKLEEIVLMEDQYSTAESPGVCDLVSKTYKVSYEKCASTFGTNAFLYLMNSQPNIAKDPDLDCKIGINIRLLFY